MRPALQKLLARPSSLDFLRCLTGTAAAPPVCNHRPRPSYFNRQKICARNHTAATTNIRATAEDDQHMETTSNHEAVPGKDELLRDQKSNRWKLKIWSAEELDFESDLKQETDALRLVDDPRFEQDLQLWAFLLDYRQQKYGLDGVAMIWESFRARNINITPARDSAAATKLRETFLSLGYETNVVIGEICEYAIEMYIRHQSQWPKLYSRVVAHFMINGTFEQAVHWHRRLLPTHPPHKKSFYNMCRRVIHEKGNLLALQVAYKDSGHRQLYRRIMGLLCEKIAFPSAFKWHQLLIEHGDLPLSFSSAFPLIRCLWMSDTAGSLQVKAQVVIKSLEDIGISIDLDQLENPRDKEIGQCLFPPRQKYHATTPVDLGSDIGDVQPQPHKKIYISREMMNDIHGEHYGIEPVRYNDKLGARWFASNWVSLDLAINAVHALGVQAIGPLSLHAIALREPEPKDLSMRIKQLKDLGISIGNSIFSRAVKYFAEERKDSELKSLLSSDQHPSEYENYELQERLLLQYNSAKDWAQFRRTLAMLSFHNMAPNREAANLILRTHVQRQDLFAIHDTLTIMAQYGRGVSGRTAARLMKYLLAPRKKGHRPTLDHNNFNIRMTISICRALTYAGQIPPRSWIEILRRLGMLGQLQDLENLCRFLVEAYDPTNLTLVGRQHIPPGTEPRSPLHPYRLIFSEKFQTSLVEWGFIHALKDTSIHPTYEGAPGPSPNFIAYDEDGIPMRDVSFGIRLLKTLASKGVWVDFVPIRKAIVNRMIVCYGPLKSIKSYNQNAKITLGLHDGVSPQQSFRKMAKMVDSVLGTDAFSKMNIETLIAAKIESLKQRKVAPRKPGTGRGKF
ncbi:hypothetical protein HYALB_00006442 [Hymenoscyphus albidus]|uniref:Pentatricopeptide repeat domain-containing protein n=1 Tax=Hymenoscyphus albidus TaxID=595503 RepID=A0A9N9LNI5_9HELO|nr:hypothetical protein HYALB_00006442 [Hymenoscyphus albidus]